MSEMTVLQWGARIAIIAAGAFLGFAIYRFLLRKGRTATEDTGNPIISSILKHEAKPAATLLVLTTMMPALKIAALPPDMHDVVGRLVSVLMALTLGWIAYRLTKVLEDYVMWRFDIRAADNLQARQVHTQFRIFQRIALVAVVIISFSGVMMSFQRLQALGAGLFASAGIVGLLAGISAQKTIGNMISGIIIALTQPIRFDDVVVVENEWGRVEEIALTYVVIKIWDLRRLIVPISYFLEKPFQNWTRVDADLIGSVMLEADYAIDVEDVRARLAELCKESTDLWDGKVCNLQVTDSGKDTLTLRALVSADDSAKCWELRCLVREGLVNFINSAHPQGFPVHRLLVQSAGTQQGVAAP